MKSEIVKLCADLFEISPADLLSRKRRQQIVHARMALYAALRKRGWSYPRIGRFCGRDHSTVMYGVAAAEELMRRYPAYAEKVEKVFSWQPYFVELPQSEEIER